MPYREGIYCLLLGQKYRRRVRQAVIYLGEAKMRMPSELDLGQTKVAYTLIDIREIDAEKLMAGGHPADLPLAMLARGGANRLTEILKRANGLPDEERRKVRGIVRLAPLAGTADNGVEAHEHTRDFSAGPFDPFSCPRCRPRCCPRRPSPNS